MNTVAPTSPLPSLLHSSRPWISLRGGGCRFDFFLFHFLPLPPPPPCLGGGEPSPAGSKKYATVSYCTGLHNYESSLLELMRTSFVLTHCTPQTSANVPCRHYCALCLFHKGACAGCCARPFSSW